MAVTIKTPSALDTNDVKVFSLKKDTVNQKPYRIVVDVQKKGVAPNLSIMVRNHPQLQRQQVAKGPVYTLYQEDYPVR